MSLSSAHHLGVCFWPCFYSVPTSSRPPYLTSGSSSSDGSCGWFTSWPLLPAGLPMNFHLLGLSRPEGQPRSLSSRGVRLGRSPETAGHHALGQRRLLQIGPAHTEKLVQSSCGRRAQVCVRVRRTLYVGISGQQEDCVKGSYREGLRQGD